MPMSGSLSRRAALILAAILLLLPLPLTAHPHMSLENSFEFVWKGAELSGMYLQWRFDKFFSADIIRAYDRDRNGLFSAAEAKDVYANAFVYVGDYHYFTFIRVGDKRHNPKGVSDFSARIDDGHLVYRFFVDLAGYKSRDISLAVYDYSFFCDIPYRKADLVTFVFDPAIVTPSYELVENKKYPIYYNPLGRPDDTTIYTVYKKGLLTFYPKEVRIRFEEALSDQP